VSFIKIMYILSNINIFSMALHVIDGCNGIWRSNGGGTINPERCSKMTK
jgi:hypothetical protein